MPSEVTCWRCGNPRAAGPSWCPTCQAPEAPSAGYHQTYAGQIHVPNRPPTTAEKAKSTRKTVTLLVVAGAGLAIGVLLMFDALGGGSADPPGAALARRACGNATLAAQDVAAGKRTMAGFRTEMRSVESDARDASILNSRYDPVLRAAVAVNESYDAGGDGAAGLSQLLTACGSL